MPTEWLTLPTEDLIALIGYPTLFACMRDIEDHYNAHLPLWAVMNYYGTPVGPSDELLQVSCQLSTHGTDDRNKSARYFAVDRETGRRIGGVYCWVCGKTLRAFRYMQVMEKDRNKESRLTDVFRLIEGAFRIPFPRHILFGFDPDLHYSLDAETRVRTDIGSRFARARAIKDTYRGVDQDAWIGHLLALYQEPVES